MFNRPMVPLAIALSIGILVGNFFPDHRILAWLALVAAAGGAGWRIWRRKPAPVLFLLLFAVLGYLLLQPWTSPRHPPNHVVFAATGDKSLITGVVETTPKPSGFGVSFVLKAEALGGETSRREMTGKLRVSLSGGEDLRVGDRITFLGRIRPIRSFANPGGFDYRRFMARQGVWASASGQGMVLRQRGAPAGIEGRVAPFRLTLEAFMDQVLSRDAAALLKALVLGDQKDISDSLRKDFQATGLGHLLAVSGLNMGLVAGVVFFIGHRLLGFIPFFLRRAWLGKGAAVPALLAITGYGFLAGMSPSVERALLMAGVFLLAVCFGKLQDSANSLALAALVILTAEPPALFDISFQLSFVSVAAILFWLPAAPDPEKGVVRRYFSTSLQITLSATLGTLPLVLYYFNQTSLIGIVTNLVFVPVIGAGVVSLGLFSVALYPLCMPAASFGVSLCGVILDKAMVVIHLAAALPFAAVRTVTPSILEIVIYYLLLISGRMLYKAWASGKQGRTPVPGCRRPALVFFLVLAVLGLDGAYWGYRRFGSEKLAATFLDVGHGLACVLELPGGEVLLVDGGGFSDRATFDVGERIVAPFLWGRKIRTVSTLICSHADSDHLGGLLFVAGQFHASRLLFNGEMAGNVSRLLSIAREKGIVVETPLGRSLAAGAVRLDFPYPSPGFLEEKESWRNVNNNSLVTRVSYGKISFLFPGDLLAEGEEELVKTAGDNIRSTVLAVPHHGSRTSSTLPFLDAVAPEMGVVSAGWEDAHGVPHPEVVARYRRKGIQLFYTARGAVTLTTDGARLWVRTEEKDGPEKP